MLHHFLLTLFRPESALLRAYSANVDRSSGLELALRYAAREAGASKLPQIAVYQDPLPAARVAQGFFGTGTVLLSQGVLSSFRDDEVVVVMRQGLELLSQRGTSVKTICSSWLTEFEKSHRLPWSPMRALLLWTLRPLTTFLRRQDVKMNIFRAPAAFDSLRGGYKEAIWHDAMHKVSCSERIFS